MSYREKSERERRVSYNIAYIWNLEKWYRRTYLQRRESDVENKFMVTKQGREEWEEVRD